MPLIDNDEYRERKKREEAALIEGSREANRRHWVEVCRRMSEIGPHFAHRQLDNYHPKTEQQRRALEQCEAIIAGDIPAGIYLWGKEPGVGKTHLAAGIVNAATERGIPSVFTTSVGLIQRIRESYSRNGKVREGERDIIERLARVEILVLDDLGTEPFTQDTARLFYLLLNQRIERNLPLIVTSNLSPADLGISWMNSGVEEHLGNKIIDRINGMCSVIVHVDGESQRGQA